MFELDPTQSYMMPVHFGPRPVSQHSSGWYRDVTMMVASFLTEREAIAPYLPAGYTVDEQAIVTVSYACNKQVDWLAGHGYNLISVNVSAAFNGEKDRMSGNYCLVMWENLTDPILTGRELQGIPKIYADIPDHSVIGGRWHTNASHFGHSILDMQISSLRDPSREEIEAYGAATEGKDNPMAFRFFPGVSGIDQSVKECTTYPSETIIQDVKVGEGTVKWNTLSWEQNPTQYHIVNALAELPVLAWMPAMIMRGSVNLLLPERMPRVIS